MLTPFPRNYLQKQKGFILKLLPEAKKINRKATDLRQISSFEKTFYELRQSFSIDFDFSYLNKINSDQLLYLVAAFGSEENYQQFITLSSLRSNVDFQNYHRQAIYIAFKYRNINLIAYFIKYMKNYEKDVDESLFSVMLGFAAQFGYLLIVQDLVKNCKCDPAFGNNRAIRRSARGGHLDVVKYLMEEVDSKYGIDPAAQDNYAVRLSALEGHLHAVKYLVEEVESKNGIDPAADDNHAIRLAAFGGHLDVIKNLMEEVESKYGIDPADDDNLAIRLATQGGHLDVVKYLMEEVDSKYGIDPAALDNLAILNAASGGHLDVVKYLMGLDSKYGIDPAVQDNQAIQLAAQGEHLDMVKYLMALDAKYGIDRSIGSKYLS